MKINTVIAEFPLAHTKEGLITVSHINNPYGENSKPVVSIGISLMEIMKNLTGKPIYHMKILMML